MEAQGLMQKLWGEVLWPNTNDCSSPLAALTNLVKAVASTKMYLIHDANADEVNVLVLQKY